jgi:hypothetical protein
VLTRVLMGLQAGRNTLLAPSPPPTAGCPHISLVFREMWDTTALAPHLPLETWVSPC